MKKPPKTPRPAHRRKRAAQRNDRTPCHPRNSTPRGNPPDHGTGIASPPYRIEYRDGRRDGNRRKATPHRTTASDGNAGNERETDETGESGVKGERKRRESNKERARENDKNGIREKPEERKSMRIQTETIETETRREQGNGRRRPVGDMGMTIRLCKSRFNR